jgi:hypothetical protein
VHLLRAVVEETLEVAARQVVVVDEMRRQAWRTSSSPSAAASSLRSTSKNKRVDAARVGDRLTFVGLELAVDAALNVADRGRADAMQLQRVSERRVTGEATERARTTTSRCGRCRGQVQRPAGCA